MAIRFRGSMNEMSRRQFGVRRLVESVLIIALFVVMRSSAPVFVRIVAGVILFPLALRGIYVSYVWSKQNGRPGADR